MHNLADLKLNLSRELSLINRMVRLDGLSLLLSALVLISDLTSIVFLSISGGQWFALIYVLCASLWGAWLGYLYDCLRTDLASRQRVLSEIQGLNSYESLELDVELFGSIFDGPAAPRKFSREESEAVARLWRKKTQLTVAVYPSEDLPGQFMAHCLDLDLMTQGNSVDHALQMILEAVEMIREADALVSDSLPRSAFVGVLPPHTLHKIFV